MTTSPPNRPFRFGLILDTTSGSRDRLREVIDQAEAAGVDILLATDHLGHWAPLPLLLVAAELSSLRVGTFVLNNDIRRPTVLAQELATVDSLTGGRLEVGLGAGWDEREYTAAGIPFEAPPIRLGRLESSIRLIRQALSEGRIDHEADAAYSAIHQTGLPTAIQRPHPPILIGGGGPRLLRFAAREADIVAINPRSLPAGGLDSADLVESAVDRKLSWIREAAGDRLASIELNILLYEVDPDFHRRSGPPPERVRGISEEEFPRSPHYLAGDEEEMIETLIERRERWGFSYISMRPHHLSAIQGVVSRLAGAR
jgi:probable F420-dependent oxidoreductase